MWACELSEPRWHTFKLWDLSCWAFWKSFMAGVTSQGYGNTTASKQETYLLAPCVLRGREREGLRIHDPPCSARPSALPPGFARTLESAERGSNPSPAAWHLWDPEQVSWHGLSVLTGKTGTERTASPRFVEDKLEERMESAQCRAGAQRVTLRGCCYSSLRFHKTLIIGHNYCREQTGSEKTLLTH